MLAQQFDHIRVPDDKIRPAEYDKLLVNLVFVQELAESDNPIPVHQEVVIDNKYVRLFYLFEFFDELAGIVAVCFDVAQFFLPLACEFSAFQQFFLYGGYEVDACFGGIERLAHLAYVAALEEGFDDGGAGRGSAYAVLFQCVAQFVVVNKASGGFHSPQQGCLGVGFGRRGPFLA